MSKLHKAAMRFNDTACSDSYTGQSLFNAQLDVFTDGVRDGVAIERRVLEVAPGTEAPARRCVRLAGEDWIVGIRNPDMFKGTIIREKFAIQRADGLAQVKTPAALLSGADDRAMFVSSVWVKTIKQVEISSEEYNQLNVYMSTSEPVRAHEFVVLGGRAHIIKEVFTSAAGFQTAVTEALDDPITDTLEVEGTSYDPVTDEPSGGASYQAVRLRWQSDFSYLSLRTPKFEHGDMVVMVQDSAEVSGGMSVKLSDGDWHIVNVRAAQGVKYVHVRR